MKYLVPSMVVIIIFLVAGLSYYMGKSSTDSQKFAATATGVPVVTTTIPTTAVSPTPHVVKKVVGGGVLSFPKYELSVPEGWTDLRESQTKDDEKIVLTKGKYQISIMQGGFGGAICLFPGDLEVEGPSARYDLYKDIKTKSGDEMRRSWTGEELKSKGFAICQNTQYGWGAPTLYGHISFITPQEVDPLVLGEMDSILASLTKI